MPSLPKIDVEEGRPHRSPSTSPSKRRNRFHLKRSIGALSCCQCVSAAASSTACVILAFAAATVAVAIVITATVLAYAAATHDDRILRLINVAPLMTTCNATNTTHTAAALAALHSQITHLTAQRDTLFATIQSMRAAEAAVGFFSTDVAQLSNHSCPSNDQCRCELDTVSACTYNAHRMLLDDLSHIDNRDAPVPTHSYDYCHTAEPPPLPFCAEYPQSEQYYQLTFYDRPGAGKRVTPREGRPKMTECVQLPPIDYRWFPNKTHPLIPCPRHEPYLAGCIHWPNLRAERLLDLLPFNSASPKNIYHFNSSYYDYEQELIINAAAKYIPFAKYIRTVIDIGAGGGSIGLLLKSRYDVMTISTVFPDWPYCELITERGGLCIVMDAMDPMPFAKFSFDVVHSSWVFHALTVPQLITTLLQHHRILRPGGYLWHMGGYSREQVNAIESLFIKQLGYRLLWESKLNQQNMMIADGTQLEVDWHMIMQRPIAAYCGNNDVMRGDTSAFKV